jgi:hypothetical protein
MAISGDEISLLAGLDTSFSSKTISDRFSVAWAGIPQD